MDLKKYFDDSAKDIWAVVWRFLLIIIAIAALAGMFILIETFG